MNRVNPTGKKILSVSGRTKEAHQNSQRFSKAFSCQLLLFISPLIM